MKTLEAEKERRMKKVIADRASKAGDILASHYGFSKAGEKDSIGLNQACVDLLVDILHFAKASNFALDIPRIMEFAAQLHHLEAGLPPREVEPLPEDGQASG